MSRPQCGFERGQKIVLSQRLLEHVEQRTNPHEINPVATREDYRTHVFGGFRAASEDLRGRDGDALQRLSDDGRR